MVEIVGVGGGRMEVEGGWGNGVGSLDEGGGGGCLGG